MFLNCRNFIEIDTDISLVFTNKSNRLVIDYA